MGKNLITGGMGFLGSYIARRLLEQDEEVVLFQRRERLPASLADLDGKVQIVSGDVGNWVHIVDAIVSHDIESIYHSAALMSRDCEASPANGFRINVIGTFNVLEAARILGIKDVIYVSSAATYGITPETLEAIDRQVFNDTPQSPENMYTTTKVMCERLGEQYWRQYGVNFRGARYAMIAGPTRQLSYYYGDWSGIIEVPAKGKPYTVHSNPNLPCSYIYVKDAVRGLIQLKQTPENKLRQRVYNFGGFMATLNEVAAEIKKHLPDARIVFDEDTSETMRNQNSGVNYRIDNTAATQDLGYEPRYHLKEMVADFINEVKAGHAG
ncbi:MAG: NAD(P)-dependent oxidoreductase [Deltaproteobacteria bacterium]|nr:NAD(P)-dependent oxidoreductase [Deltaproteobacteria bacterium]MBW2154193.1 NAD(P)-dependent oxidoreductase [Deltaproteobacteria bacterium]